MKIVETYSHFNGLEYLLIRKKKLWTEIQLVIRDLDADARQARVSRKSRAKSQAEYRSIDMSRQFCDLLKARG